jgi:hypothetical protein
VTLTDKNVRLDGIYSQLPCILFFADMPEGNPGGEINGYEY